MPFGSYKNFADCVSKNQDKSNPEAYCGTIQKKAETVLQYGVAIEKFEPFTELKGADLKETKSLMIHGTAIQEVVSRNGVKYIAKELEKATNSLKGRPILKDHKNDVDHIIGKVMNTSWHAQEKAIKYQGLIVDEKIQHLINTGMITSVSIGASVRGMREEESNGEKVMVAEGIEILELSVTPIPGIPTATVSPGESFAVALQESYNAMQEQMSKCPDCGKMFDSQKAMNDHMKKEHTKNNSMEEEIMEAIPQDVIKAKEALTEAILAFDNSFTKEELLQCDLQGLNLLLKKARVKKTESVETPALPKGVVNDTVQEKKEDTLMIPVGADEALKGVKAGTFVVERSPGNKISFFKMPDYKKMRYY